MPAAVSVVTWHACRVRGESEGERGVCTTRLPELDIVREGERERGDEERERVGRVPVAVSVVMWHACRVRGEGEGAVRCACDAAREGESERGVCATRVCVAVMREWWCVCV